MRISLQHIQLSSLLLLCISIAGCSYIIPEDPSAPRHNKVLGDTHRPQLNNQLGGNPAYVAAAPAVDPYYQAPQAVAAPISSPSGRRIPIENQQFAGNFPAIDSVPPRPVTTGEDSAKSHLEVTKTRLEKDRTTALDAKKKLINDAAKEESILSELPKTDGVIPPNDPVQIAPAKPVPPEAPRALEPQAGAIAPTHAPVLNKTLPEKPVTPAPAQPEATAPRITYTPVAAMEPKPVPVAVPPIAAPENLAGPVVAEPLAAIPVMPAAPAPMEIVQSAPQQPVALPLLPPPAPLAMPLPTETAVPVPAPAHGVAKAPGDFDPLAAADNFSAPAQYAGTRNAATVSYVNQRTMAASRYAQQRF